MKTPKIIKLAIYYTKHLASTWNMIIVIFITLTIMIAAVGRYVHLSALLLTSSS